jgi:methylmalonyl-CoA/ethylmalonyl-CoA epimerase
MPNIRSLDHIAIATDDLEASLKFYEEQLGIKASHTEDLEDRGIRVAFLPVGDTRIELITPLREGSEVSGFLQKRGPGIHHLCFSTPDVDGDVKALKDQGVRLATEEPAPGAHGCRVAFIHPKASKGTLIELSTPPDGGAH